MFFKGLIAAFVWALGNAVYLDMKRKGKRGFTSFCAFWAGTPTTWFMLFFVKEGVYQELPEPPDDPDALLAEIRRDRALTDGPTGGPAEASEDEDPWGPPGL